MVIMDMKSGIYMWTSPSGKSYIGQATDLDKRKSNFLSFNKKYAGSKIDNARRKYNDIQYWTYTILEYCDINDLDEREEYYISLYNTMRKGYNCESGGHENKIISDETKQKMSEAKKDRYCGENNPRWGKHLTEEQKRKMSEGRKGKCCGEKHPLYRKHLTEEQKHKISEGRKGKYCGENSPMWGKHLNDETRIKISKAHDKKKIPVSQYTIEGVFITSYESIHEAQRLTNIDKTTISRCCRGIQKTAGGFKWTYKNPTVSEETMG